MGQQKLVDYRVDDRVPFVLIADAEAEVEHQGQVALRRVARGVVHRAHHAAMDGDAAARVVCDLEAHDLRARRHAVEPRHVVEAEASRDAGDVRAMA